LTKTLQVFVKKPIVTIKVVQVTNNRIYVAGDGVPSQVVHLASRMTLFNFLCSLPGLENGDLRRAYLIRDQKRQTYDFHALLVEGDFTQDVDLQPEDTLFIPSREQSKVYVLGAVTKPSFIYFRDGLKVLDAILESGGFTEFAKENSVVIHRRSGEKLKVKGRDLLRGRELDQNVFLKPGDYITVEESLF
jgi:polysaccharide export outer membrane protein